MIARVRRHFTPDQFDHFQDGVWCWMEGDTEYELAHNPDGTWRVGAASDSEVMGVYGDSADEALSAAASNEWEDHEFVCA